MRREKISLTCSQIPRCRLGAAFSPVALPLAPPSPLAGSTRQQQMTGASPSETAATMPKVSAAAAALKFYALAAAAAAKLGAAKAGAFAAAKGAAAGAYATKVQGALGAGAAAFRVAMAA